jgi:hypothetical protein
MRSLVTFCSAALLLVSCSKDTTQNAYNGDPQLSRILVGGQVNTEFGYDAMGRLVRTVIYQGAGSSVIGSETIRHYDAAGLLVKIESSANISSIMGASKMDLSYAELSYDANKRLTETKNYNLKNGSYQYVGRVVPQYDAAGRTVSVTNYSPTDTTVYNKSSYQYNAQNNVVAEEFYQSMAGIPGPSWSRVYEYDQKKNPYKDKWVMPYGANQNNITKVSGTSYLTAPGVSAGSSTYSIVYKTYNANGYPTLVNENGVDYVYEYK